MTNKQTKTKELTTADVIRRMTGCGVGASERRAAKLSESQQSKLLEAYTIKRRPRDLYYQMIGSSEKVAGGSEPKGKKKGTA